MHARYQHTELQGCWAGSSRQLTDGDDWTELDTHLEKLRSARMAVADDRYPPRNMYVRRGVSKAEMEKHAKMAAVQRTAVTTMLGSIAVAIDINGAIMEPWGGRRDSAVHERVSCLPRQPELQS